MIPWNLNQIEIALNTPIPFKYVSQRILICSLSIITNYDMVAESEKNLPIHLFNFPAVSQLSTFHWGRFTSPRHFPVHSRAFVCLFVSFLAYWRSTIHKFIFSYLKYVAECILICSLSIIFNESPIPSRKYQFFQSDQHPPTSLTAIPVDFSSSFALAFVCLFLF